MNRSIEVEETEHGTVYRTIHDMGASKDFRIVQTSDNKFTIEELTYKSGYEGMLWWKKWHTVEVWKEHCVADHLMLVYETLEAAKKYIYDYVKYPIYH